MKFSTKDFFSKCDQIQRKRNFLCSDILWLMGLQILVQISASLTIVDINEKLNYLWT